LAKGNSAILSRLLTTYKASGNEDGDGAHHIDIARVPGGMCTWMGAMRSATAGKPSIWIPSWADWIWANGIF